MGASQDAALAPSSGVKDAVAKLREFIGTNEKTDPGSGWEKSWQAGTTPWDMGDVTPVLAQMIAKGEVPTGRALVPGCGSGYDVLALASPERHVVGLDISRTANEKAKRHQEAQQVPASQAEFVVADFFTWEPEAPFDVIFDYTFFCALEPDLRQAWAQRMAQLLAPAGQLITLVFPIDDHSGGPPFAVNMDIYKKMLVPAGFVLTREEEVTNSVRGRQGKERLAIWEKKASGKM
ncbi:thiol methyltransferase [Klebsormidium nitens]|uniref:Thiol methyltransferase n=1 Tax=Klebsormidium nitens TaxID=105231 RepID=A0A1Y1HVX8_KLENI|nr:thiol methyltransferase [Klebsormidium nitens]|eukprot:GAQ82794.1 thiol methyltransferase [Klebsormidium nitens]